MTAAWKPELGRFQSDYAFRGLADYRYPLLNSFTGFAEQSTAGIPSAPEL